MKFPLALALFVCATSGFSATNFVNGQAARAALGQYEFTQHNTIGGVQIIGADGGIAWDAAHQTLWEASGNIVGLIPVDNRVLGFSTNLIPSPTADLFNFGGGTAACRLCGFPASIVLGQVDFSSFTAGGGRVASSTSQGSMNNPTAVATDGNYFAVVDTQNDRVLLWNHVPQSNNVPADVVLGQPNFTTLNNPATISASTMRAPLGVWIQNGKLFVADTGNNRVLVWNSIPTQNGQAADLVLGQPNFSSNNSPNVSASTTTQPVAAANVLWNPISVTSDGTHLFVADLGYNRVLIWNRIPTQTQQPADVEVGQVDMKGSTANDVSHLCSSGNALCAKTLQMPRFAISDGIRLFIADTGNDRVLVYNNIPTDNAAAADAVLGQPDFVSDVIQPNSGTFTQFVSNAGSVYTTPAPTSLAWDGTNLYVADPTDGRILAFTPGDVSITGQEVLNNASELLRQEGLILLTGSVVSGDTVSVTISVGGNSNTYTYTIKKGDTLQTIVTGVVNAINANSGDANVQAQAANLADTVLLVAKSASADLNTIGYSATTSNTTDITAAAAGTYLTGGSSGTLAPGTLFEIDYPNGTTSNGLVDFPLQTADTTKALPQVMNGPAGTSSNVQVYVDGINAPILSAGPAQIVAQVPYRFVVSSGTVDRNSLSIYARAVHNDGSVVVTNAAPVSFTNANPGLFGVNSAVQPKPAVSPMHQPGNPSVTVYFSGSVTTGDSVKITVGSNSYSYTAVSGDTLPSIAQNLVNKINAANDSNVTAALGAGNLLLSARSSGSAGTGVSVSVSTTAASSSGTATETFLTSNSTTCCKDSGTGAVTAANPALPNEIITFLGTGFGLIQDKNGNLIGATAGQPYNGAEPNVVINAINSTVNGTAVSFTDASIATGAEGVYEVHVQMPSSLPTSGVVPVYVAQGVFISNTVTVPVGPPTSGGSAGALLLTLDSPKNGQSVIGSLQAYGWALDPNSPVAAVTVSLDGNSLAAPSSMSRADVCAVYPNVPDCQSGKTPGWTETIDTTTLNSGSHTLSVTATAANGDTVTRQITFAVPANTLLLNLDGPTNNQTVNGPFTVYGWAGDTNGSIPSVTVSIDGAVTGTPSPSERSDVCAVYPTLVNCQNGNTPGWTETINANNLTLGSHILAVTAIATNGQKRTQQVTIKVARSQQMNIDGPQGGSMVSGIAQVYGWATSTTASMPANNVILRIDGGTPIATVSAPRADVCAAITTSYDCAHGNDNVGFNANLDTTVYANGPHTLLVESTDSNGVHRTGSETFTISNSIAAIKGSIDLPTPNQTLVGQVLLYGWAAGPSATVNSVSIWIDGAMAGTATLTARPDVCAMFPTYGGCPNGTPGWSFPLDTTTLADGPHQLQIVAATTGGVDTLTNMFNVANWTTSTPVHVNIDSPSGSVSGVVSAFGWAVSDEAAISSVAVTVDGVPLAATYGAPRGDVCAAYPNRAGCLNVGWTAQLDTTQLSNGSHTFTLIAKAANGQTYTVANNFEVANGNNNIQMNIDTDLSTSLSAPIVVSGWAGSTTAAITSVRLTVDGSPTGLAETTALRPDVCAVHPNLIGCPAGNLGWAFSFNPGLYTPGPHTLAVTAGTGSSSNTEYRRITVAQPSGPVFNIYVDNPPVNTTFVGTVSLRGWDADSSGNSGAVTFAVDGAPVALDVTYSPRADVCAAFHYTTGCAQTGWSTLFDSTVLADGPHTLQITSSSNAGTTTVSRSFTVANWSNVNPIQIAISNPAANVPQVGQIVVSGSASSQVGTVSAVMITIDNLLIAQPAVLNGTSWTYNLDTTALPDGTHTLNVTAIVPQAGPLSATQQQSTASTTFTTQNYTF